MLKVINTFGLGYVNDIIRVPLPSTRDNGIAGMVLKLTWSNTEFAQDMRKRLIEGETVKLDFTVGDKARFWMCRQYHEPWYAR